jgi:hypothetical protein
LRLIRIIAEHRELVMRIAAERDLPANNVDLRLLQHGGVLLGILCGGIGFPGAVAKHHVRLSFHGAESGDQLRVVELIQRKINAALFILRLGQEPDQTRTERAF